MWKSGVGSCNADLLFHVSMSVKMLYMQLLQIQPRQDFILLS